MRTVDITKALKEVAARKISERAVLIFDPKGTLTDAKPLSGPNARDFWYRECKRRARAWPTEQGAYTLLEFDRGFLVHAERFSTKAPKRPAVVNY